MRTKRQRDLKRLQFSELFETDNRTIIINLQNTRKNHVGSHQQHQNTMKNTR